MTHPVKLISTTVLVASRHIVLVKYKDMPDHQQGWFLPHDLLQQFEHPTDGARRALRGQLGFAVDMLSLKHLESFKGRDGTWHLSFHHLCNLPETMELKPSTDLAAAQWFPIDKLPPRDEVAHRGWALDTIEEVLGTGV